MGSESAAVPRPGMTPNAPAGLASRPPTRCSAPIRHPQRRNHMDADAKKTALRMIPYGIYVLTADDGKGNIGAATVNWVTQGSFAPPLVVVGVKGDSGAHTVVKGTGKFVLNMLGKDQKGAAFAFFKPAKVEGNKLSGMDFHAGHNGAPVLNDAIAAVECSIKEIISLGDHDI